MSELTVRPAREDDVDRLLEIHFAAFPNPRDGEARRRNFLHNPLGPFDRLRVGERGGAIVAHAFLFPLEVGFGGAFVRTGAIASVGVAPEARARGVAAALLDRLHAEADADGCALTLLYAFRQGFYARHAYAPVTPTRRLDLAPRAIPAAWASESPDLRVAQAIGAHRDAIVALYIQAAARTTGWIRRPTALWDKLILDERRRWFVLEDARGDVVGFTAWSLEQRESHAHTRLVVHDLVAVDDRARRALLGFLRRQKDQVASIAFDVDADDPIDRALVDADRGRFGTEELEHPLGALVGGPMVRTLDPIRAVEARGYARCAGNPASRTIDVDLDGIGLRIVVDGATGRARATWSTSPAGASASSASSAPPAPPALRIDRATFAAVLYGALRPSDAARLGWIDADAPTLAAADAIFALPPYFAVDPF